MTSHQITGDSAMANFGRRNYDGAWHGKNQVVIGIDIGTTQSGVAFTHLSKNAEIVHHRVTEWPGQDARSSAKIPSVIWYDRTGRATSFGAEALTLESEELAADRGWKLAQHFKLHLHPQDLRARYNLHLDPLPTGVPLSRIYTNFLNYLLVHTRFFFEKHVVGNAKDIWEKRRSDMIFVIAHPNGWQLKEQAFLRSAAVDAGFTTRDKAEDQIRFVTEAEASTHFCLHHTHLRSCLNPGTSFAVCDAGGSTVDTTLYITESVFPKLRLAEAKASECIQAGAMFVDKTAKGYLERLFEDANVPPGQVDEYLNEAIPHFELHGKRKFDNTGDTRVKVGTDRHSRDNPPIRRGQLKLSRSIVRSFFDPFVQDILASVDAQVSPNRVPHILLVGGFGENPYLYQQMKAWFEPMGCLITSTSNEPASKAVADGAVIWHCVNYVSKRTPHYAYGIEVALPFDRLNPDHQGRSQVELPSGIHVRGGWSQIVAQGVPVDCNEVTRQSYVMEYSHPHPDLSKVNVSIYRYKYGNISRWMTTKSGKLYAGFTRGCVVTGDLRGMRKTLKMYTAESGVVYWALVFHVCFRFGLTETKAFLEWVEEGVTKTGPATLVTEKVV